MKAILLLPLLLLHHVYGQQEEGEKRGSLKVTFPLDPGESDISDKSDEIWDVIEARVNDELNEDIADIINDDVEESIDIIQDRLDDSIDSDFVDILEGVIEDDLEASLEAVTRVKRQFTTSVSRSNSGVKTGCTINGFETREREVCEEIVERICTPLQNVKYRKEIYTRCDTRLRQECNNTVVEVPKEVCQERRHKECFQDFDIVEDTRYTTQCESIVQHVCEEHYKVAVPKPVVFPVPIFAATPTQPPVLPPPTYHAPEIQPPAYHAHNTSPAYPPPGVRRSRRQLSLSDPALLSRQVKQATVLPPQPAVSHQELPAPPGCRSVVTQKCHKVPEVYPKKVPGVNCYLELELVETPKCYPVPVEECDDILKEIPYLVDDEECNLVPRLDCNIIEEQIPIQVCTTVDIESATVNFKPGARLKAPPPNAKLTKDKDALAKLKEVLDPDDIEFLRKKLLNDRRRVPKSLNLNNNSPRDLEFLLDDDTKPKTIPRTILPKEEIEKLKKRAQESSSPSQLSRDNLGRLELLVKGYL